MQHTFTRGIYYRSLLMPSQLWLGNIKNSLLRHYSIIYIYKRKDHSGQIWEHDLTPKVNLYYPALSLLWGALHYTPCYHQKHSSIRVYIYSRYPFSTGWVGDLYVLVFQIGLELVTLRQPVSCYTVVLCDQSILLAVQLISLPLIFSKNQEFHNTRTIEDHPYTKSHDDFVCVLHTQLSHPHPNIVLYLTVVIIPYHLRSTFKYNTFVPSPKTADSISNHQRLSTCEYGNLQYLRHTANSLSWSTSPHCHVVQPGLVFLAPGQLLVGFMMYHASPLVFCHGMASLIQATGTTFGYQNIM